MMKLFQFLKEMNKMEIVHLQNVFVGNHGLLYDYNGNILGIKNLSDFNDLKNDFHVNNNIKSFLCCKNTSNYSTIQEDQVVIKKSIADKSYTTVNSDNYIYLFHFFNIYVWGHLWDSFNWLEEFENINDNFKLAVPKITNHVKDLQLHFQLVGYDKDRIVSFPNEKGPYLFPNLFVNTKHTPAVYISNKKWIEKKYIYENPYFKYKDLEQERYKIYLSRDGYCTNMRQTLNEDKVWNILKNKGYIKLNGNEGLLNHIKFFMNAEKIIASHGSLIKNMAFCLRNPEIWEFYPLGRWRLDNFPRFGSDKVFQSMAKDMGIQKYFFIPVESDKCQNILLDLELIDRIS
jgi:hypothetical protein